MKFYRMTSSLSLRRFRVIALKINKLNFLPFVTKNNLRGIRTGIGGMTLSYRLSSLGRELSKGKHFLTLGNEVENPAASQQDCKRNRSD